MEFKKLISLIIALAVVACVIFALVTAADHPRVRQLKVDLKQKVSIFFSNLRNSVSPPRKHPLTTVELEESLMVSLPVPFAEFNQEDWGWFWQLLYGSFTIDSSGWPKRKGQLTKEEIQDSLAYCYPRTFGNFRQRQWNIFWQQVLKGKVL